MQTILLTGATGFLGSHLLKMLLIEGYNVYILKRSTSNTWRIKKHLDRVKSYDVDIEPIEKAFEDKEVGIVIHTACHYGRNNDPISKVVETNLLFSLKLIETAIKFNTSTFFNTDTLLQKYLNTYTISKKQFVEWLKELSDQINVVNLKLEHMYGPNDDLSKFTTWVVRNFLKNKGKMELTPGKQKRDFIYVNDVVDAYKILLNECLDRSLGFSEYEVGSGKTISIQDFVQTVKMLTNSKTKPIFGARPYRKNEIMYSEADTRKLLNLGWKPKYTLKEGLTEMIEMEAK